MTVATFVTRPQPVQAVYAGMRPLAVAVNPLPLVMSLGRAEVWSRASLPSGWELRLLLVDETFHWGVLIWPFISWPNEGCLEIDSWQDAERLRSSMASEVSWFRSPEACEVFLTEHDWGCALNGLPVLSENRVFLKACLEALRTRA